MSVAAACPGQHLDDRGFIIDDQDPHALPIGSFSPRHEQRQRSGPRGSRRIALFQRTGPKSQHTGLNSAALARGLRTTTKAGAAIGRLGGDRILRREPMTAQVLVVDDEPMIRDVLAAWLGHEGYECLDGRWCQRGPRPGRRRPLRRRAPRRDAARRRRRIACPAPP